MKIYLAGPVITNDINIKKQMDLLENAINSMNKLYNIEVYRPGSHKVPNAWGIDMQTWAQCVFTMDVIAIDECDWMVVADYGRQATAGTAWECGYAFAKNVKILVVQMPGVEESSLMTQGCAANICKYENFIDNDTNKNDDRFEKFFFERGRKQNGIILN